MCFRVLHFINSHKTSTLLKTIQIIYDNTHSAGLLHVEVSLLNAHTTIRGAQVWTWMEQYTQKDNWPGKTSSVNCSSCLPSTSKWCQTTSIKSKHKTKQINMSKMIHGLKDTGKRDRTGRKSYSVGASPTTSPSDTDMEDGWILSAWTNYIPVNDLHKINGLRLWPTTWLYKYMIVFYYSVIQWRVQNNKLTPFSYMNLSSFA